MKSPSDLIINFLIAIACVFLAYALGRMFLRVIKVPQVETENDFESQLYIPQNISLKL